MTEQLKSSIRTTPDGTTIETGSGNVFSDLGRFHAIAQIFPLMGEVELAELARDIQEHGQREPIQTHEGKIIDGRNRFLACAKASVKPRYQEWGGTGSLAEHVWSLNAERRHLTPSQKAACAVLLLPLLEAEAKGRQGTRTDLNIVAQSPQCPKPEGAAHKTPTKTHTKPGKAREAAAKKTGASPRRVSDAKKLQEIEPEVFKKVHEGTVTLTQAMRIANHKAAAKNAPTPPTGKFRVLYADPPWKYNDALAISGDGLGESYGPADAHYPPMTITDLCELPIRDIAEDNAVLFIWVTSPLLEDVFPIIKAWGFKYKTSIVWNKMAHNMGHYTSVRHEFLLLCTRGSCLPDIKELLPSVVEVKRGKHSEKPEEFRQMIDRMYPNGERIELFARAKNDKWQVWGNQC